MDILTNIFHPIQQIPCWNVELGYNSQLTLNFGTPSLEIREPKSKPTKSLVVQRHFARRRVTVLGAWRLWIYMCDWRVFSNETLIAERDDRSARRKNRAIDALDGQILTHVEINFHTKITRFDFDLGTRLESISYDEPGDEPSQQWMLFEPSGCVFTFRSDGMYSYASASLDPEQERWKLLPQAMPFPTQDGEAD